MTKNELYRVFEHIQEHLNLIDERFPLFTIDDIALVFSLENLKDDVAAFQDNPEFEDFS